MKNIWKFSIRFFLFVFVLLAVGAKLLGMHGRYDLSLEYDSLTWQQTWRSLPQFFFASLIISIFVSVFYYQYRKNEEWRLNEARKRIAEREKKEKEEQSEKQKK